jgi:hypothetical protein
MAVHDPLEPVVQWRADIADLAVRTNTGRSLNCVLPLDSSARGLR